MRSIFAVLLALLAGAASAQPQPQPLPPLSFDAPAGFSGGGQEVATFSAAEGDVAVHVYPFRRMGPGDFQARFRETLLREFVAANLREKAAGAAQIQPFSVEGADAALVGRFTDGRHERSRLAILSAGAVAVVDVTADSAAAMERHAAALKDMLDSLSVGQPKARAAPPPEVASAVPAPAAAPAPAPAPAAAPQAAATKSLPAFVPGLYVGNVRRLIPNYVGGVQSGGMWVNSPQYFVLSREGLAHRNYLAPRLPGGDASQFDWTRAQRDDAADTGTYQVLGGELTLRFGTETISAKLKGPAQFDIFGSVFKRTTAK